MILNQVISVVHSLDDEFLQKNIAGLTKFRQFDKKGKKSYKLTLPPQEEMKVRFESRFENGNLRKAIKVSDSEYNLVLSYDYNTSGHTQWFYFKMHTKLSAGECNFKNSRYSS